MLSSLVACARNSKVIDLRMRTVIMCQHGRITDKHESPFVLISVVFMVYKHLNIRYIKGHLGSQG